MTLSLHLIPSLSGGSCIRAHIFCERMTDNAVYACSLFILRVNNKHSFLKVEAVRICERKGYIKRLRRNLVGQRI